MSSLALISKNLKDIPEYVYSMPDLVKLDLTNNHLTFLSP